MSKEGIQRELTADVNAIQQDFNELSADVKRIRTGFAGLSGGGGIWSGLTSILGMLVSTFRLGKK